MSVRAKIWSGKEDFAYAKKPKDPSDFQPSGFSRTFLTCSAILKEQLSRNWP